MDLVRDLLDKRVVDRNGRDLGRVDRIVLRLEHGRPRVDAIEIGPSVLGDRISSFLGRLIAGLEHAFAVDAGRPYRIPIGAVLDVEDHIKIDAAFGETPAATIEQRLRRWVGAIPGSS
jgi:sporulation protein YlmC with PRC-barrel domain